MEKNLLINGEIYDVSGRKIKAPLASDPSQLAEYFDISDADTPASSVKAGEPFYAGDEKRVGTMPVNEAIDKTLNTSNTLVEIAAGYTPGGTVRIVPETKTVKPSEAEQVITPSSGKVLSEVTVEKITDEYAKVTDVTATPEDVKTGKKFVDATGALKEGTHTDPVITLANSVLSIR